VRASDAGQVSVGLRLHCKVAYLLRRAPDANPHATNKRSEEDVPCLNVSTERDDDLCGDLK
jgi:hypothetical protein